MNSISKGYYDSFKKENKEEKQCPTIIKSSCPNSTRIVTTAAGVPSTSTIASFYLDVSCLCEPKVKLEFITNIFGDGSFLGTVTYQVFKKCNDNINKPVGTVFIADVFPLTSPYSIIETFFVCDSDFFKEKGCLYTVVATANNARIAGGTVNFNNSVISVIATCASNKCERCHKK